MSVALGERERRRASLFAGVVAAVVFGAALILLFMNGIGGDVQKDAVKITESSETVNQAGKPSSEKRTISRETTPAVPDQSLIGRAFANGAAPILFQFLLAALAAFAAGFFIQRVLLGAYGITVGPVSFPELPSVKEPATAEAGDLIKESPQIAAILKELKESPQIAAILGPGPRGQQPFPQFMSIEDDRLALLSIRTELEKQLRELAEAAGVDRDVALSRLPSRLVLAGAIDDQAARGLRQLIEIGDRIAAGAEVEPDADTRLRNQAFDVLYALGELRRRISDRRETRISSDRLSEMMTHAKHDEHGDVVVAFLRKQDQDVWDSVVVAEDLQPLVFWAKGAPKIEGAIMDSEGNILMVAVSTPPGVEPSGFMAWPCDATGSPLGSLVE